MENNNSESSFHPHNHSHDSISNGDIINRSSDSTDPDTSEEFVAFNCKSCSLPIREGHAYELKNDRWHIKCFKCSKCSKFLGVNSNFLVLGTGALVCSDCSYTCRSCNKKIYDMAILTGDKAYCASCFKCKSCKKPIDDLRYARTSKGLFCMPCHNRLMEKKKKYEAHKARKEAAAAAANSKLSSNSQQDTENNNNIIPLKSKPDSITPPRSIETSASNSNSIIPTSSNTTTKSSTNYETISQTSSSAMSNVDKESSDLNSSGELVNNINNNHRIQYTRSEKVIRSPVNTLSQFEINDYANIPDQEDYNNGDNELTITLENKNNYNPVDSDGLSFSPSSKKSANIMVNSSSFRNLKDLTTPKLSANSQFTSSSGSLINEDADAATPSSTNQFHFTAVSPLSKASSRSPSSKPPPVPLPDIPISPSKNNENGELSHQIKGLNITGTSLTEKLKSEMENDNDNDNDIESTNGSETTTDDTFIGHLPDDLNTEEFQTRSSPFRFGSTSTIPNDNREKNISQSPNHSRMASNSSATRGSPIQPDQQQQQQQQQSLSGTISRTMSVKKFFGRHKKNSSSTGAGVGVGRINNTDDDTTHTKSNSISNGSTIHQRKPSENQNQSNAHLRTLSDQSTAFKTPELPMASNFDPLLSPNSIRAGNRSQPHSRTASSSNPFNGFHNRSISQTDTNSTITSTQNDSNLNNTKELLTHYEQQLRSLKSEVNSFSANKAAILRDIQLLNNQKKTLEMEITEKQNKIKELDALFEQKQKDFEQQQKQITPVQQQTISNISNKSISSSNEDLKASPQQPQQQQQQPLQHTPSIQHAQSQPLTQTIQKVDIVEVNNVKKGGLMRRLFRSNTDSTNSNGNGNNNNNNTNNNTNNNNNNSSLNGSSNTGVLNNNGITSSPKKISKEDITTIGMSTSPSIQSIGAPTNFRTVENEFDTSNMSNDNINISSSVPSSNGFSSMIKSRSTHFLSRGLNNNNNNNSHNNVVEDNTTNNEANLNPNNTTGLSIYDMTIQQRSNYENRLVPFIFTKCIEEIEKKGLYHEGLYRISGSAQQVEKLERIFDSNHNNGIINDHDLEVINNAMEVDVHVIVGLLKRYLRYIPSSVIPTEKYDLFISIHQLKKQDDKFKKLKKLLNEELPKSNKFLLFQFAKHLNLVLEDKENKMHLQALTTVISNTLIMDDGKVPEKQALDVNAKREITELIILHYKDLLIL